MHPSHATARDSQRPSGEELLSNRMVWSTSGYHDLRSRRLLRQTREPARSASIRKWSAVTPWVPSIEHGKPGAGATSITLRCPLRSMPIPAPLPLDDIPQ